MLDDAKRTQRWLVFEEPWRRDWVVLCAAFAGLAFGAYSAANAAESNVFLDAVDVTFAFCFAVVFVAAPLGAVRLATRRFRERRSEQMTQTEVQTP